MTALVTAMGASGNQWGPNCTPWAFGPNLRFVLSLLYLAVIGSVVAFLFYYGLARRRGYTTASYVLALTPLVAMAMSTLFEGKSWGFAGLVGVALVLLGHWLLLRTQSADEERAKAEAEPARSTC